MSLSQYLSCWWLGITRSRGINTHDTDLDSMGWLPYIQDPLIPNSRVHGANIGPIWGWQDPDGPHVGPMNFAIRAPSQYPKRRLFVRSRKVSKPRDWYFKLSYRFEIWQAHRQHCCRSACEISERSDNSKYKSRGFETLRDLTERRLFGYWDGALGFSPLSQQMSYCLMVLGHQHHKAAYNFYKTYSAIRDCKTPFLTR